MKSAKRPLSELVAALELVGAKIDRGYHPYGESSSYSRHYSPRGFIDFSEPVPPRVEKLALLRAYGLREHPDWRKSFGADDDTCIAFDVKSFDAAIDTTR
jgi:hypothetical protein